MVLSPLGLPEVVSLGLRTTDSSGSLVIHLCRQVAVLALEAAATCWCHHASRPPLLVS